jgi:hypothetical protein
MAKRLNPPTAQMLWWNNEGDSPNPPLGLKIGII